ncbi:MAG: methyltransferase domain-containing protein [Steroidobacteraceae bacterium]
MSSSTTAPRAWWQANPGAGLLHVEASLLRDELDNVFGWEMLQVGDWGPPGQLLRGARTRRQTAIGGLGQVQARAAQLPIASDSIDAVLLPHTLEYEIDPYAVIREVDRVLVGEGTLLILGFRPLGPWGMRALAARHGFPPGLKRVNREGRLRDWLKLLGYEVAPPRHYLYSLPMRRWGEPLPSQDSPAALRRGWWYPLPASAYILRARKRLFTLTPVRQRRSDRRRLLGGLANPTTQARL